MDEEKNEQELISFNGVNGSDGSYIFPELSPKHISKVALGEKLDEEDLASLALAKKRHETVTGEHFGVEGGAEVARDVTKAGWAVVVSEDTENIREIIAALKPLLDHRKNQVGDKLYKQLTYKGGKDSIPSNWLARHKVAAGTVVPEKIPFYILLVGSPEEIPFNFQFTLDVQYAVGRIHFDSVEEYAAYANQIVENEKRAKKHEKKAMLFGVKNDFDKATEYSIKYLISPLSQNLKDEHSEWSIDLVQKKEATKETLKSLLHSNDLPSFLLTASHGMGFTPDDPRQREDQGALLCSDWPGPMKWEQGEAIPNEHYLAANDLSEDINLDGMIVFLFACYSAATPRIDNFNFVAARDRSEIAPDNFISSLPKRLLTSGASAVIAHVDRAWASSFLGKLKVDNTPTFKGVIDEIFNGSHVGYAMEHISDYYSVQESEMSFIRDDFEGNPFFEMSDRDVSSTYVSKNDARNYVVLGDPAAKLIV